MTERLSKCIMRTGWLTAPMNRMNELENEQWLTAPMAKDLEVSGRDGTALRRLPSLEPSPCS